MSNNHGFGGSFATGATKSPAASKKADTVQTSELTDEIRDLREKNKRFQATNDHQTYLVVTFSTKEDKEAFLDSAGMPGAHTIIDGYDLAAKVGKGPTKPKFRLHDPISAKK